MLESALTSGLFLTSALLVTQPTSEGREAARYASIATYRQSGLDKEIEPRLQYLEHKYIPEALKTLGVSASFIYRAAIDHKIEYSWSF